VDDRSRTQRSINLTTAPKSGSVLQCQHHRTTLISAVTTGNSVLSLRPAISLCPLLSFHNHRTGVFLVSTHNTTSGIAFKDTRQRNIGPLRKISPRPQKKQGKKMTNRAFSPALCLALLLRVVFMLQYPAIVQSEIIALDVFVDASSDEVRVRTDQCPGCLSERSDPCFPSSFHSEPRCILCVDICELQPRLIWLL
jgi:hypothetical protein